MLLKSFHCGIQVQPSSITFKWELSRLQANGIITGFIIQYGPSTEDHFIPEESRQFGPEERRGTIEGLLPGQTYVFQMQARTQVGYGSMVRWTQEMPVWAPPKPVRTTVPTIVKHSANTVTVRFRRNYFSDVYGKVIAYAVSEYSNTTVMYAYLGGKTQPFVTSDHCCGGLPQAHQRQAELAQVAGRPAIQGLAAISGQQQTEREIASQPNFKSLLHLGF